MITMAMNRHLEVIGVYRNRSTVILLFQAIVRCLHPVGDLLEDPFDSQRAAKSRLSPQL